MTYELTHMSMDGATQWQGEVTASGCWIHGAADPRYAIWVPNSSLHQSYSRQNRKPGCHFGPDGSKVAFFEYVFLLPEIHSDCTHNIQRMEFYRKHSLCVKTGQILGSSGKDLEMVETSGTILTAEHLHLVARARCKMHLANFQRWEGVCVAYELTPVAETEQPNQT